MGRWEVIRGDLTIITLPAQIYCNHIEKTPTQKHHNCESPIDFPPLVVNKGGAEKTSPPKSGTRYSESPKPVCPSESSDQWENITRVPDFGGLGLCCIPALWLIQI